MKVYVLWDREYYGDPRIVGVYYNQEAAKETTGIEEWEEERHKDEDICLREWLAEGSHGYRHIEEHEVQ